MKQTIEIIEIKEICKIIRGCLLAAAQEIHNLPDGEQIIKQGEAFGDINDDTEIKADEALGKAIIQEIEFADIPCVVTIEGHKEQLVLGTEVPDKKLPWFCIDPLDGSLNYHKKGDTIGLPYSSAITVLSQNSEAKFNDIEAAGIIDLRSCDMWLAHKKNGTYYTTLNDEPACTSEAQHLDIGSMIVIGEMYYPENREVLIKIFDGEKGSLRNPGSAAFEMALVASGQVVAFICDQQKLDVLGAAFALVKGAGGVVVDFNGVDISYRSYDFKSQTPVVLAANKEIVEEIISNLKLKI